MRAEKMKSQAKFAEWNTNLVYKLRVANEHNDRLKVRVVELTVLAFCVGFWVGVIL